LRVGGLWVGGFRYSSDTTVGQTIIGLASSDDFLAQILGSRSSGIIFGKPRIAGITGLPEPRRTRFTSGVILDTTFDRVADPLRSPATRRALSRAGILGSRRLATGSLSRLIGRQTVAVVGSASQRRVA
jgi:hypothetical protein